MLTRMLGMMVALSGLLLACERAPEEAPPKPQAPVQQHEAKTERVASVGESAPEFSLRDTEGNTHALRELRGKTVVLEWFNPDCPFVKSAHTQGPLVDLAKRVADDKLVWLAINSNAPGKQGHGAARNADARRDFGLLHPVLLDENGDVGRAYGATKTPHMFVIDARGVLVYRGGLDNAPMGVVDDARPRASDTAQGERSPYLERALADLTSSRSVALSDTPAYGCSVKYAD